MDKNHVHLLRSKAETSTLLGGERPSEVAENENYISPLALKSFKTDETLDLDHAIDFNLNVDNKTLFIVGPEGCGKTAALNKVMVDWAKGERLQNFSHIFHISLKEIHWIERAISLEKLLSRYNVPVESIPHVLQKPEQMLFIMDDLDQYRHSEKMDGVLCSDPKQEVSASVLIASLLKGSLLKGASFLVATRPTSCLNLFNGGQVKVLGFLKHQREVYFENFFRDPSKAAKALDHMERTLGFYDLGTSPRFLWSVCSIYQSLMDSSEPLPETLSQLCVCILVCLMRAQDETKNRKFITALGRVASSCLSNKHFSCTREDLESDCLQHPSLSDYLHIHGTLESDKCIFLFHSRMISDFILALTFFLDGCESVEKMMEKHKCNTVHIDLFLSGMSEASQRGPLEAILGKLNEDQIHSFKDWFKTRSKKTLDGCSSKDQARCFQLLHQSQSASLVKEIISPSARIGIGFGELSLQDYVGLGYVVSCLGEMKQLNVSSIKNTTMSLKILAPAMSLSHRINLSNTFLTPEAVTHVASSLRSGLTKELDLSYSPLDGDKFKILCGGLQDSKIQRLIIPVCSLNMSSCDFLVPVLTSASSQLCVLDMRGNSIGDPGLNKLCEGLQSPNCKLQELQLQHSKVTALSMEKLAAVLSSGFSELRDINLTNDHVGDKGVEMLCSALQHPLCKLRSLNLFDANLTAECCSHLKRSLMSDQCSLVELDLSLNEFGQEGALLICQALNTPGCSLEKLGMVRCELTQQVFKELGLLLKKDTTRLTSLSVGLNHVEDEGVKYILEALAHPNCALEELDLEMNDVTDASVEDVCSALKACRTLKNLVLKNNTMTDAAVPALVQAALDSPHVEELNLQYNDFSEDVFDLMETCRRIRY